MPNTSTVICPECEQPVPTGEPASNHAKLHWLSNPNVGINDLKGEARRRYDFLVKAKAGESYEYGAGDKRAARASSGGDKS